MPLLTTRATILIGTWNVRTNVRDREDQSNINENEEIQLDSTGNQRNPLDPSWTAKAKYGIDAAIHCHGKENATHIQGVVLMLSKVARGTSE
ncbi:unnamed protein product [Schistosoma margrebowiei]|uniref:Uncharacterized protein n=1 Tax=Schistosoma margrebowiei TaxID=48269 RepID=A0A183MLK6_9TREM|nr:unnamed protein product [Schistosoma margrebowiei]